jgi:hypothetical protein
LGLGIVLVPKHESKAHVAQVLPVLLFSKTRVEPLAGSDSMVIGLK